MKVIPTRKVAAGVLAGAFVTILAGVLRRKYGVELTGEEGAAYALLLTFIVQWLVPDKLQVDE